ncbi:MAG: hypothetical protein P1V20_29270 [Verrucomicrobiales bacterium]|nr:hypothetical protein [Verrucomicrobiales bacterium]
MPSNSHGHSDGADGDLSTNWEGDPESWDHVVEDWAEHCRPYYKTFFVEPSLEYFALDHYLCVPLFDDSLNRYNGTEILLLGAKQSTSRVFASNNIEGSSPKQCFIYLDPQIVDKPYSKRKEILAHEFVELIIGLEGHVRGNSRSTANNINKCKLSNQLNQRSIWQDSIHFENFLNQVVCKLLVSEQSLNEAASVLFDKNLDILLHEWLESDSKAKQFQELTDYFAVVKSVELNMVKERLNECLDVVAKRKRIK